MVAARNLLLAALALAVLPGCPDEGPEPMDSRELLIRASLDLRGVRPTVAEFEALEADPESIDDAVSAMVDDDRFGERVRALFAPTWGTQVDLYGVRVMDYGLDEALDPAFQRSVGEEALRMISHIATDDLPYTELVTGEWTMANELLGVVWPVDYPAGETGWRRVAYTDSRPAAGVLATNSLWWRYPSNGVNYNRGRANAVSRLLLCEDYLERPVSFPRDIDLTDQELVDDAIRNNAGCVNCHVSLDPLASYLFGFTYANPNNADEITTYHPEREQRWQNTTGVAPAFYGQPGYTLTDLGHQIAADNRFAECAVERVYEGLLRRDVTLEDRDALTEHREAFIASGLSLKALFRSVLADDRYRAATSEDGGVPRKVVDAELFASQLEDLTGYRFTVGGYDMMQTDLFGLRSLAGGSDGYNLSPLADSSTPTMMLSQERVAQAAAWWAVAAEADLPPVQRRLFTVGFPTDPDGERSAFVQQIQVLHHTLSGTRVERDGEEVAAAIELWSDLFTATPDAEAAWAGVLSVLLRDPDFVLY